VNPGNLGFHGQQYLLPVIWPHGAILFNLELIRK